MKSKVSSATNRKVLMMCDFISCDSGKNDLLSERQRRAGNGKDHTSVFVSSHVSDVAL